MSSSEIQPDGAAILARTRCSCGRQATTKTLTKVPTSSTDTRVPEPPMATVGSTATLLVIT